MTEGGPPVLTRMVTISNKRGMHARAAAKFVTVAEQFGASVEVVRGDEPPVSARSIMGLMMLGAGKGCVQCRANLSRRRKLVSRPPTETALANSRLERRLSAILAADVAGYSRLVGADEEGTIGRLRDHRAALFDPKITEYRGRLVKTTGDGLLAEFASVVDAVRCAVDVQR